MMRTIFISLILISVLVPLAVQGALTPLVTCKGLDCTTCEIFEMIARVVRFILFALITPATVIALLIGGILLVTAGGSEQQIQRGKSILWHTVIGFMIAFGAWLIINTILHEIVSGTVVPKNVLQVPHCEE